MDSAFGIRQATPRRGPPRPPPDEPSGEAITPETPRRDGTLRREPVFPRSLRLSDRVSTSSPGAWETAGRRWPSSPAVEWMVPGRADHSADAGSVFGKAPGPRQVHALSGYAAGTPSSAPASSTPSAPSAPFRGHERPRQDHGPGTAAFRRPAPPAGEWPAAPGMDQGSHSPGSRRAARRCSSRDRGDWPGTCGQGLHRGAAAGEAASSPCTAAGERGTGTRTGRRRQPAGHTLLLSRSPGRVDPGRPPTYNPKTRNHPQATPFPS